ncbi:MAG: hypothetical protein ABI220_04160 [Candidatus Saccharimonadales bacterium]
MGVIVFLVAAVIFAGLFAYRVISKRKREQAMATLAAKNGWTALANDAAALNGYLPGYILGLGQQGYGFGDFTSSSESYDMAYQAIVGTNQAVFFQYIYTEYHQSFNQDQQETSDTHTFTVINVAMPVSEPVIMLLHHSFISKMANFGLHSGLQKLSLEGDFNQAYDTYITPHDEVNALSLLTPDVMELVEALAGNRANASMQLRGQSLIISFERSLLIPEIIEPLLAQISTLLAKLDTKPQVALQAQPPTIPQPQQPEQPTIITLTSSQV